jgi:hypothetical protein
MTINGAASASNGNVITYLHGWLLPAALLDGCRAAEINNDETSATGWDRRRAGGALK